MLTLLAHFLQRELVVTRDARADLRALAFAARAGACAGRTRLRGRHDGLHSGGGRQSARTAVREISELSEPMHRFDVFHVQRGPQPRSSS